MYFLFFIFVVVLFIFEAYGDLQEQFGIPRSSISLSRSVQRESVPRSRHSSPGRHSSQCSTTRENTDNTATSTQLPPMIATVLQEFQWPIFDLALERDKEIDFVWEDDYGTNISSDGAASPTFESNETPDAGILLDRTDVVFAHFADAVVRTQELIQATHHRVTDLPSKLATAFLRLTNKQKNKIKKSKNT